MKVMGRCKGDFQLEIDNFKVLIVVTKYNNCFFCPTKGSRWPIIFSPFAWGLMLNFFFCKQNYTVIFIIFIKLCSFKQTPF